MFKKNLINQLRLFDDFQVWVQVRDGNPVAADIFSRHYSKYHYKDGRTHTRFVGPGERIVLITKAGDALFVWRKFINADGQKGVNCSVFRNENKNVLSYQLLNEAEKIARERWLGERMYTYVNPKKIKSSNPGYCFKMNGWKQCGITKKRKLIILEKNDSSAENYNNPCQTFEAAV